MDCMIDEMLYSSYYIYVCVCVTILINSSSAIITIYITAARSTFQFHINGPCMYFCIYIIYKYLFICI